MVDKIKKLRSPNKIPLHLKQKLETIHKQDQQREQKQKKEQQQLLLIQSSPTLRLEVPWKHLYSDDEESDTETESNIKNRNIRVNNNNSEYIDIHTLEVEEEETLNSSLEDDEDEEWESLNQFIENQKNKKEKEREKSFERPKLNNNKRRLITEQYINNNFVPTQLILSKGKGNGVKAMVDIEPCQLVIEYKGELIGKREAQRREKIYAESSTSFRMECYLFYFEHKGRELCVDPTIPSIDLGHGRYINHRVDANLDPIKIVVNDQPKIVLVSNRTIKVGEELFFDYGDRSAQSLTYFPWLNEDLTSFQDDDNEEVEEVEVEDSDEDVNNNKDFNVDENDTNQKNNNNNNDNTNHKKRKETNEGNNNNNNISQIVIQESISPNSLMDLNDGHSHTIKKISKEEEYSNIQTEEFEWTIDNNSSNTIIKRIKLKFKAPVDFKPQQYQFYQQQHLKHVNQEQDLINNTPKHLQEDQMIPTTTTSSSSLTPTNSPNNNIHNNENSINTNSDGNTIHNDNLDSPTNSHQNNNLLSTVVN